jgi:hypothetical protein
MLTSELTSPDPLVPFTDLWAGMFQEADAHGRAMLECFAMFSDPRTARRLWLEVISQAMDGYLRSPAFLESMRAGLEIMTEVKVFQNQLIRDFAGHVGAPLASDIHELSERLRRTEEIVMTELKAIENRLANIEKDATSARDVIDQIDS